MNNHDAALPIASWSPYVLFMAGSIFKKFSSDEELLRTEFRVCDPLRSVENLVSSKPDAEESPIIMGFYDETPAGGRLANPDESYLWCCHCQKDTHWKGYVIEDASGTRYTIGNRCGHDHYGASFSASENVFKERRARQGVLRAFLRLRSKIAGLEEEIQSILGFEGLRTHEAKTRELRTAAPKGFQALKKAVERGELTGIKKTRNFAAEVEREARFMRALKHYHSLPADQRIKLRDDGLRPERDDDPIIDLRQMNFGFVVGTSILGICDVRTDALSVRKALSEFRNIERSGTEGFASRVVMSVRKDLFDTTNRLRDSLIDLSFAQAFFEEQNLSRIAEWSNCHRGFSFILDHGVLRAADDGQALSSIAPLECETAIANPVLDRIHYTEIEDELISEGAAIFEDPDDPTSRVLV